MKQIPAELSHVVKKIRMRDLDLACVSKARYSHSGVRFYDEEYRMETFSLQTVYNTQVGVFCFCFQRHQLKALFLQHPHQNWDREKLPIEELVSKLDKLRSENPMLDALVVGERPFKRCMLIRTESTSKEEGVFYYVPYCG